MDDEKKVVLIGTDARNAIRNAVRIVGEAVSRTLGPYGRNGLIDRGRRDRSPLNTNDGVSIAKSLRLDGKIRIGDDVIECTEAEDRVAHTIIEAATRTDQQAGDGTTTATTLTRAIVETGLDKIPAEEIQVPGSRSMSVMAIAHQLEDEKQRAVSILKEMSEPVDTLEKLKDVAFTSLENREVADIVAEAVYTVGKDGFVTIEEGYEGKVEAETVKGMKIYGKVAATYMYTNDKRQSVYTNTPVLVTNATFATLAPLQKLFGEMQNSDEAKQFTGLVIMASKFEASALRQIYAIAQQTAQKTQGATPFRILAVKVPSLTDEELEDVAAYLGAKFINTDSKIGGKVEKIRYSDLGFAEKLVAGEDETIIIGGKGTKLTDAEAINGDAPQTLVDARLAKLRDTFEVEHDEMFKNKLKRRIEILSGGVSVIRVGAQTDTEKAYLKLKVEDAMNACKCALQEGIVPGGGKALQAIAEQLGEDALLYSALCSPYERIQYNAGGDLDIPDTVIDPTKVVRCALENAVSVAKQLITTEVIVVDKKRSLSDELTEMLAG